MLTLPAQTDPTVMQRRTLPDVPLLGIGAGGHARALIDALQAAGARQFIGLLDPQVPAGKAVMGVPVLGDDHLLTSLAARSSGTEYRVFLGIGATQNTDRRRRLYDVVQANSLRLVNILHPSATVSTDAALGNGIAILAQAHVGPGVVLGANSVVNTGAIIEHDCRIGPHVFCASGAVVTGGVTVGEGAFIGAGATIRQGIRIGENACIGAGAVVVKDVAPRSTVVGSPARPIAARPIADPTGRTSSQPSSNPTRAAGMRDETDPGASQENAA